MLDYGQSRYWSKSVHAFLNPDSCPISITQSFPLWSSPKNLALNPSTFLLFHTSGLAQVCSSSTPSHFIPFQVATPPPTIPNSTFSVKQSRRRKLTIHKQQCLDWGWLEIQALIAIAEMAPGRFGVDILTSSLYPIWSQRSLISPCTIAIPTPASVEGSMARKAYTTS